MKCKSSTLSLFGNELLTQKTEEKKGRTTEKLKRLDLHGELRKKISPLCRLRYVGQYDLWFEGIKVEVKACRAINTKKRGNIMEKALGYDSDEPFWMNYQQIKVDMADVFVLIGVWIDKIVYWIMNKEEIKENKYLSPQHRGGIEYQIGMTHKNITDFDIYRVEPDRLGDIVLKKGKKR